MLAWLWVLVPMVAASAQAQSVRALVIGIDDYRELPDLAGAVNDARDIARALSGVGVRDLTLLENLAATRKRISSQWRAMIARAQPGDTLVLTYAGHGGQEPARTAGSEQDGLDEVLLLGGFTSSGLGSRERIFDDELNRWFSEAGEHSLRVIFVADSCHAGTLTRSIDARVAGPAVRTVRYTVANDMLRLELPEAGGSDMEDLPHVSFLAAGQEYEQVPEVALPGKDGAVEPRGALSYMFARALEGAADFDRDGVLRRSELWRFVRENVRMISEARQTPNLLPNDRGGESLLRLVSSPSIPPDSASSSHSSDQALRLAVVNASPVILATLPDKLPHLAIVSLQEFPDLIWDARARQVVTGIGDVAGFDVDFGALPGTVGKWKAIRAIRSLSLRDPLRIRVNPHDGLHQHGNQIEVEIGGLEHPYLTLLGLSGNGTVHYLYPLLTDPTEVPVGQPFRLELKVTPPFGADHIVALAAGTNQTTLNAHLAQLNGSVAAAFAAELIAKARARTQGWQSGVQGLFTAP
ncbi:MAG: caspase family protein [Alphaproteobacteria bacterium]|nr:caspase family protein [Alphaproteobacteria bacterium]